MEICHDIWRIRSTQGQLSKRTYNEVVKLCLDFLKQFTGVGLSLIKVIHSLALGIRERHSLSAPSATMSFYQSNDFYDAMTFFVSASCVYTDSS